MLLKTYAGDFMHVLKELFQKDLDLFEEKRLQDVLMCKAEATSFSVADEDLQELWQQRLSELLDKRNFYLQVIVTLYTAYFMYGHLFYVWVVILFSLN